MPPRARSGARPGAERRRASLSMEAVLTEAVALLDRSGESALTFRALAERLGGGVASIYWYVAGKDELLDRAADHVLAGVIAAAQASTGSDDPVDDLRTIAVTLFDAVVDRPWLGAYFLRDTGVQPNGLHLFELMGQQTLRLDLTARQSFHAVSAVIGFVVGTAADMGRQPPAEVVSGELDREEYVARAVDEWRALPPDDYPFIHRVIEEFATHDDADVFRAGLDLILAGLRLQAGR